MVYKCIVANNVLGGTVTDASLTHAATYAYKGMLLAGNICHDMIFKQAPIGCLPSSIGSISHKL